MNIFTKAASWLVARFAIVTNILQTILSPCHGQAANYCGQNSWQTLKIKDRIAPQINFFRWCVKDCVCVCDKAVCDIIVWQSCLCDKDVCGRWCVKDGVWKMVCDKDGVWKMVRDKDGVWQSCVWKIFVWKMVCERWCVTKMVCDKAVRERWCETKMCVKDGVW